MTLAITTTRHRVAATSYRVLARTAHHLDRLSHKTVVLVAGVALSASSLGWLGADLSHHAPTLPAAVATMGPNSTPALMALSHVEHMPGVTVTGLPQVIENGVMTATVFVPTAGPHRGVIVVLDGLGQQGIWPQWRIVDVQP